MNKGKQDSSHRQHDRERDLQNTPKATLLSLLLKEERSSKQTRKLLNAALSKLDSSTRKLAVTEADVRKADDVQLATGIKALRTVHQAQEVATQAQTQLNAYKFQLEHAQREMQRAQEAARIAEKLRLQAEQDAVDARTEARRLREQQLIIQAREEGLRQGMAAGFKEAALAANLRESRLAEQARRRSQNQRRFEAVPPTPVTRTVSEPRPLSTPSIPPERASSARSRTASLTQHPPSHASTTGSPGHRRRHSRASSYGIEVGAQQDLRRSTAADSYIQEQRSVSRSPDVVHQAASSRTSTRTTSPVRSVRSLASIPPPGQTQEPVAPQGLPYLRMPTPPSPRSRSISSTSTSRRQTPAPSLIPAPAPAPQPVAFGIPRTSSSGSGSRPRTRTPSDAPAPGRRSPDAPTPSSTATGFSQLELITFPNPMTDYAAGRRDRDRERERFPLTAIPEHLTGSSRASVSPQVPLQVQVPQFQPERPWTPTSGSVTSSPTTVATPSSVAFSDAGDAPPSGWPTRPSWLPTPDIVVTAALENEVPRPIPPPLSLQQDNFLAPYRPGLRPSQSGDSVNSSHRLSTESSGSVQIMIEPPSRPASAGMTHPNTAVGFLSPNHAPPALPAEPPSQPRHYQQQDQRSQHQFYSNPNPPPPASQPVIPPPGVMDTQTDFPPGFVPNGTPASSSGRLMTPAAGTSREQYALAPTPPGLNYPKPLGRAGGPAVQFEESDDDSSIISSVSGTSTATIDHTPRSRNRRELVRENTKANSTRLTDIYAMPPPSMSGTPATGVGLGINGGGGSRPAVSFSPRANVFIS